MLQDYAIDGYLLIVIKLLYCQPEVCVPVNDKQSKLIHVSIRLRQGCSMSPLLFIVYMNLDGQAQSKRDVCHN